MFPLKKMQSEMTWAMSQIVRILFVATALVLVGAVMVYGIWHSGPMGILVYAAPTLAVLADDAAGLMGGKVDVVVMGSVAAVRQFQMGAKPDVILSVDAELVNFLSSYRKVVDLGRFELILVCRKALDLKDIGRATIGLADPNIAPVGYRTIAALYWLSVKSNLIDLNELERSLSVKFVQDPDGKSVLIDVRHVSASGRFKMREDLSVAFTMLENGSVDCVFAYTPFAVSRNLVGKYHVLRMPEEISFANDPPVRFKAITTLREIEVKGFTAVAIVFTEQGEEYVDRVLSLNLTKYGLSSSA
jgi:molybdate/tungstate transport system substrate-binding protein